MDLRCAWPTARAPAGPQPGEPEGAVAFLRIEGMHCSSCETLIDRMAERIGPLHAVRSNYATATARVVYDPEKLREEDLPALLSGSGYRASLRSQPRPAPDTDRALFRVVTATSLAAVVMMAALPTGNNALLFAQRYRVRIDEATTAIVVSTFAFVGTSSAWLAVLAWLG